MLLVRVEILVLLPTKLTDIAPSFCRQENTQSKLFSFTYRKTKKKKIKFGLFQKRTAETKRVMQGKKMVIFIKCFPAVKLCF